MADGRVGEAVAGAPQGGVIGPLLANVVLHELDRRWGAGADGVLVRYADDRVPRTPRRGRCSGSRHSRRCRARDGGRPSGAASQGEAPSHRKVRRSRAGVLSVAGTAHRECVRYEPRRRARANHPMTRRKRIDDARAGAGRCPGMSLGATCPLPRRRPAWRGRELGSGSGAERGSLAPDSGPAVHLTSWSPGRRRRDPQVAEATRGSAARRGTGADRLVVAMMPGNAGGAKGAGRPGPFGGQPPYGGRSR